MITVLEPATSTRLTTVLRAKALLGFAAGEVETVGFLIDQASAAIVDHCRRPFAAETALETFEGPSRFGGVLLGRSAVTSVLSVAEGSTAVLLDRVRYDSETGQLFHVGDDGWRLCWADRIAVTYRAGYVLPSDAADAPASTLPAPVERAAIKIVGAYLSVRGRDALIKSETTEGVGMTSFWMPGRAGLADPEAEGLLADYRRLF